MLSISKKLIKSVLLIPLRICYFAFNTYDVIISSIFPKLKNVGRQQIIDTIDNDINLIQHSTARFYLHTPNHICSIRQTTFSSKEPEMLEWIEEYDINFVKTKHLEADLYEIITDNIRALYGYQKGQIIIVAVIFLKKTQKHLEQ